jgi:hypothetical protein
VSRKIFGPKRYIVWQQCRILHYEELRGLYKSPNYCYGREIRALGWAGHVARMGETRNVYTVLMRKFLEMATCNVEKDRLCEDNIKTNLGEIGCLLFGVKYLQVVIRY